MNLSGYSADFDKGIFKERKWIINLFGQNEKP